MMERYRPRRRSTAVWSPFREIEEMERMMEENFGRPTMWRRLPEEEYVWAPSIEMYEKNNSYILRLEIPGVDPEDVDISLTGETLTVKGERKAPGDIQDEAYQVCEMCYGSFSRSITLPEPVDSANIKATFENGILDIRIPKAEESKPRQIKIQGVAAQPESAVKGSQSETARGQSAAKDSESVADSARSISEREQEEKSKIPYEG
jgi:HSP20 family protein